MYICECGKEFENSQSFNGHKSSCKIHLELKYGNLDQYNEQRAMIGQKNSITRKENNKKISELRLNKWISEKHTCEHCGKVMTEYYGSGRFCCQSCANSKQHSEETKKKISDGLKKETICYCQYCNKEFNTLQSKVSHEAYCSNNPNRKENPQPLINHIKSLSNKVKVLIYNEEYKRVSVELNITKGELEEYRKTHKCCEICGKPEDELSAPDAKKKTYQLSIDHNHDTNEFRGLLCVSCNGKLGRLETDKNCEIWYEKNKSAIEAYLNKDKN